ncbi:CopD family protein [Paenibacillus thalictri]|nr:CopD family protein [Paenibacillus thalictri]
MYRWLVSLLLATGLLLSFASGASAHANMERSSPLADAELNESPNEIRIKFTEPIDPKFADLKVENAAGTAVKGEIRSEQNIWLIYKIPKLNKGVYTVKWQVLSVDTHVTDGSFRFSIGEPIAKEVSVGAISLDPPRKTSSVSAAERAANDSQSAQSLPQSTETNAQPGQEESRQVSAAPSTADMAETNTLPAAKSELQDKPESIVMLEKSVRTDSAPSLEQSNKPEKLAKENRAEAAAEAGSVSDKLAAEAEGTRAVEPGQAQQKQASGADALAGTKSAPAATARTSATRAENTSADKSENAVPPAQTASASDAHAEHMHQHETDWRTTARQWLRIIEVLTAVAVCGFLAYRYWIWPATRREAPLGFSINVERRLIGTAAVVSSATGFLTVWMLAEQLNGIGMYTTSERIATLLSSTWIGTAAWLRPVLALLMFTLTWSAEQDRSYGKWIKTTMAAVWVALFPLTGHALGATEGAMAAVISHLTHIGFSGLWFGGLSGIFASTFVRKPTKQDVANWYDMMKRFSRFALPSIIIIGVTGAVLAIMRLHLLSELVDSRYGRLVMIKTFILLFVAVIGALHRKVWMPGIERSMNEGDPERALGRSINGLRIELMLALAAFVIAGALSTTSPPSAVSGTLGEPVYWHVMGDRAHMSLRIKQDGSDKQSAKLDVWLPTGGGSPVQPTFTYYRKATPEEAPLQVPLTLTASGPDPYGFEGFDKYTYDSTGGRLFNQSGEWQLNIAFSDSQGFLHQYEKTIEIP